MLLILNRWRATPPINSPGSPSTLPYLKDFLILASYFYFKAPSILIQALTFKSAVRTLLPGDFRVSEKEIFAAICLIPVFTLHHKEVLRNFKLTEQLSRKVTHAARRFRSPLRTAHTVCQQCVSRALAN